MRLIAHYLPQYHRIPENDAWWGEGFTDWTNVARARPLFPGHYQPRVPQGGAYDLTRLDVIRRQAELARAHGIAAFCHYHYWFDGRQLLEQPTNLLLEHKDIDIGICLAWANESWSRRWDGQDHQILVRQTHPEGRERWELHFRYLQRAFTDPRALTVDRRPVFLIYRPQRVAALGDMLDYFRECAHRLGLPGLYLVAMEQCRPGDDEAARHFDAQLRFEPFSTYFRVRARDRPVFRTLERVARAVLPQAGINLIQRGIESFDDILGGPTRIDYPWLWNEIAARDLPTDRVVLPGAFVDWDNTARYGRHAIVFEGATPQQFEKGLERLAQRVSALPAQERLLFVNAWNEWAEGCYLEADERNGPAWLQAARRVAGRHPA